MRGNILIMNVIASGPQPPVRGPVPVLGSNGTGPQAAHLIETEFKFLGLYPKLKTSAYH